MENTEMSKTDQIFKDVSHFQITNEDNWESGYG